MPSVGEGIAGFGAGIGQGLAQRHALQRQRRKQLEDLLLQSSAYLTPEQLGQFGGQATTQPGQFDMTALAQALSGGQQRREQEERQRTELNQLLNVLTGAAPHIPPDQWGSIVQAVPGMQPGGAPTPSTQTRLDLGKILSQQGEAGRQAEQAQAQERARRQALTEQREGTRFQWSAEDQARQNAEYKTRIEERKKTAQNAQEKAFWTRFDRTSKGYSDLLENGLKYAKAQKGTNIWGTESLSEAEKVAWNNMGDFNIARAAIVQHPPSTYTPRPDEKPQAFATRIAGLFPVSDQMPQSAVTKALELIIDTTFSPPGEETR